MEFQTPNNNGENPDTPNPNNEETPNTQEPNPFSDDIDSTCSTPYVSAPSSPGRGPVTGFFYSAPASPMHFALSSLPISKSISSNLNSSGSFEFEFSARFGPTESGSSGSMISADELFLNGQIRPMKLSTHLERPQVLAPLLDLEVEDEDGEVKKDSENFGSGRGRDLRLRDKSMRRRTRSMSPLRNASFGWREDDDGDENESKSKDIISSEEQEIKENEFAETAPSISASSSRSSSAGRSSKRWVFLKDFLYRSKSEGRSNNKFWSTISFSPLKEKKPSKPLFVSREKSSNFSSGASDQTAQKGKGSVQVPAKKLANGIGKRRLPPSAHELHYTANRAQAEEMRKKTYLPYRQGLLGCLGFSSKGYGAVNGFARALNPVSSR